MALIEGCKHSLEITVPEEELRSETDRVVKNIAAKVRLPGFRPGKAPTAIVRQRFAQDIRQEVLEQVLPKAFRKRADEEHLKVVGTPSVTDIHFHENEPLRFKAEFEVAPEVELNAYKGLEVPYQDPAVTDEDVNGRVEELREQKADYVNEDPRPLASGDFAVLTLRSLSGVEPPVDQKDLQLELGGEETLPAFTDNLIGLSPGDEKEFEVEYPEDYGSETLAGKTIQFHGTVQGVRRKELPELTDEFAQDLGDFKNMEELRNAVRQSIHRERESSAQLEAKNKLVESLIEGHEFPVPEAYVDRQIESQVEDRLRQLSGQGVDPSKLNLDWAKIKESQRDRALKSVKGSLLLEKVGDVESIHPTQEEVDREVQRIAKQRREPVAATRQRLEKDGTLERIASYIRTEKVLQFLFENARKVAPQA